MQAAHSPTQDEQDRDLLELLSLLDTTPPLIPDALIEHYMVRAGVESDDPRLKRLVALIGQKFVADIASDAMHYTRARMSASGQGAAPMGGPRKLCLTLEDLTAALAEHGLNIRRPAYYT